MVLLTYQSAVEDEFDFFARFALADEFQIFGQDPIPVVNKR